MKSICTLISTFLFFITSIYAQAPVNDDCINAIDLVLGINACSNPVNGTTETMQALFPFILHVFAVAEGKRHE